jgi:nitrite reductase/ring-hydroxylating ferredoxin subunit
MVEHDAPDTCGNDTTCDSTLPDRRSFLKNGLMAVAALTALGAHADKLHAMTLSYATAIRDGAILRYPIPAADGATVDAANKVIIVRFQNGLHAFALECPHRGTDVEWQADRGRFYCPKHKSTFQPEGTFIAGKAERNMDRYPVRIEGAELVVDTAAFIRSDRDATAWAAAKVSPAA